MQVPPRPPLTLPSARTQLRSKLHNKAVGLESRQFGCARGFTRQLDSQTSPLTRPRAEELVRMALELKPENEEAKSLLREFLGDDNCRRKEMRLQVHFGWCLSIVCVHN